MREQAGAQRADRLLRLVSLHSARQELAPELLIEGAQRCTEARV